MDTEHKCSKWLKKEIRVDVELAVVTKAAPEHMGNRPGAEQRHYIMAAHVKFPLLTKLLRYYEYLHSYISTY